MSEEFNEAFLGLAMQSVVDDLDSLLDQVLRLEAMARHSTAADDHESASAYANEAYALFMAMPVKALPTFIMALADRYNREREHLLAALDAIHTAEGRMTEVLTDDDALSIPFSAAARLGHVRLSLVEALEVAPYEKNVP